MEPGGGPPASGGPISLLGYDKEEGLSYQTRAQSLAAQPFFSKHLRRLGHVRCTKQPGFEDDRAFVYRAGDFTTTTMTFTKADFDATFKTTFLNQF